jgi:mono/diheme cytochrome c family protein
MKKQMPFLLCFSLFVSLLACQSEHDIKKQKYITEGQRLYKLNCANCHQTNGAGLAALYPPLANSDYLANKDAVICLIKYGLQGEIVVNGKRYNRPMPAQAQLSDLEVAEITTFLYDRWTSDTALVGVLEVTPKLKACRPPEGQLYQTPVQRSGK